MHYLIHIGTHKTGTSSIQTFCVRNRKALLDKGFCYPENPRSSKNFNFLASQIAFGKKQLVGNYLEKVHAEAEKAGCHTILISAESFYAMSGFFHRFYDRSCPDYWQSEREFIEALYEVLPPGKPRILCYLRRQDQFLESIYNQSVKHTHGFSGKIDDFVNKLSETLDYRRHLEIWSSVFGAENISVRCFQQAIHSDLTTNFLTEIGITSNADFTLEQELANERLHRDILEYKRIVNAQNLPIYDQVMALHILWTMSEEREGLNLYQSYMEDSARASMIERFKADNQAIATLIRDCDTPLFEPYRSEATTPYPGLNAETAIEIAIQYETRLRQPRYRLQRLGRYVASELRERFRWGSLLLNLIRKIRVYLAGRPV